MRTMKWITDLKELLFPRFCKVCGRRLMKSEQHLCLECLIHLPRTHYELRPENKLMQHFMEWPEVVSATAYMYYQKESQYAHLIHHLKYYDHPETGTFLGRLAAKEIAASGFFEGIDLIVPVPLSPKKKRKRGYNQCDYIAQGISEATGIATNAECIERAIDNETQTRKGRTERWENTKGIFCTTDATILKDKHILIVDDVCTTGATLHACISEVLTIPGVRVSVFALAKTEE